MLNLCVSDLMGKRSLVFQRSGAVLALTKSVELFLHIALSKNTQNRDLG